MAACYDEIWLSCGLNSNQQSANLYENLPMTTTLTIDMKQPAKCQITKTTSAKGSKSPENVTMFTGNLNQLSG